MTCGLSQKSLNPLMFSWKIMEPQATEPNSSQNITKHTDTPQKPCNHTSYPFWNNHASVGKKYLQNERKRIVEIHTIFRWTMGFWEEEVTIHPSLEISGIPYRVAKWSAYLAPSGVGIFWNFKKNWSDWNQTCQQKPTKSELGFYIFLYFFEIDSSCLIGLT